MGWGIGYPLSAIREAAQSGIGWAIVIGLTIIAGFCCGQWIGHGELLGPSVLTDRFLWVFMICLAYPEMFIPYAVAALAWYLPTQYEGIWLRIIALPASFVTWLVTVACIAKHVKGFDF
jgi:hypothetical protein